MSNTEIQGLAGNLQAGFDSLCLNLNTVNKNTIDKAYRLIECVRDIPFAFTLDRSVSFLLRHELGSCTAKHQLLHRMLGLMGIESRLVRILLEYDSQRLKFHECTARYGNGDRFPHTSLQLNTENGWRLVDVTFDRFISQVAPINESFHRQDFCIGKIVDIEVVANLEYDPHQTLNSAPDASNSPNSNKEKEDYFRSINRWLADMRKPHYAPLRANQAELRNWVRKLEMVA